MTEKKGNTSLALAALACGLIALPITAFVNIGLGLVLLSLPIFLIYKAS